MNEQGEADLSRDAIDVHDVPVAVAAHESCLLERRVVGAGAARLGHPDGNVDRVHAVDQRAVVDVAERPRAESLQSFDLQMNYCRARDCRSHFRM